MRATRGAAAKKAAKTPDPILDGFVFAITGNYRDYDHDQTSLTNLIQSLGGKVTKSVAKSTTHLVCSDFAEYKSGCAKVTAAKGRDMPLVKPEWLLASVQENKALALDDEYLWTDDSAAAPTPDPDTGKKRPIAVANPSNGSADDEPKTKKAKATKGATKATKANGKNPVKGEEDEDEEEEKPLPKTTKGTKASKASSKASAKKEEKKKEEEEVPEDAATDEKVVAEGQFIKKKDFEIPRDEVCPLQTYKVYIDPVSGLIYDASLNQSNSTNNNNKFYRLQVSVLSAWANAL